MRQRDRQAMSEAEEHELLFDDSSDDLTFRDDHDFDDDGDRAAGHGHAAGGAGSRVGRADRGRARRRSGRRGRVLLLLAAVLVAVVVLAGYFIALPIYHYFNPSDYDGSGTGSVVVVVHPNDGATQIGQTLHDDGVVASVKAFTDAASGDSRAQSIQPGSYRLRHHMSAAAALNLLLDPSSRVNTAVVVPEGVTTYDIAQRLAQPTCGAGATPNQVCGLGASRSEVDKALADVSALGLPTDFTAGGTPRSAEGFLFPATYSFDDKTSPADALSQMVTKFTDEARTLNFTRSAKALHLTPYQALIIASMAQAEANNPADMAKVVRVILNRLALRKDLQIDATTVYALRKAGKAPSSVDITTYPTPYSTYLHAGLPPTPISNPGEDAMNAVAHPAVGNWLYYVNADAQGHLFFTNSAAAFARAKHTCAVNHWGCSDS